MTSSGDGIPQYVYNDRYARVNGLRLHYTDWNPTAGRPVLLVHGLNVQCHTWDPVAALLAETRRVICPDLRGHGDSDWASDGYAVEAFSDDLAELVRQVSNEPVDYVGHSLGARLGYVFGGAHGDVVSRMVLVDTGPELPATAAQKAVSVVGGATDVKGFRNEEEAVELYARQNPEWTPVFHKLHARYQLRRNWANKLVLKADPDVYWITRGAGLKEVPRIWESASKISVPLLIVWAQESPFFDKDIIGRLHELIPDLKLSRPPTGHYVQREQPELFAELVQEFLDHGRVAYEVDSTTPEALAAQH